jgi:ketosteroid isomerase-like protein
MAPSRRALLTGFLVAPPVALAQAAPRPPATAASATQEVLALRETIRAAVAKKDKAALEALYLENFMHLRDSGRADLKPERIALLLSGEETIETAPEENVAVHIYGAATAVATGASQIKDPATKRPAAFRWVVVYARGENGWQVALSQASRVPPPRR